MTQFGNVLVGSFGRSGPQNAQQAELNAAAPQKGGQPIVLTTEVVEVRDAEDLDLALDITTNATTEVADEDDEVHAVYLSQKLKREPSFKGKTALITQKFAHFRALPSFEPRAKVWEGTTFASNATARLLSNHASFDVIQYADDPSRAGMSMIHILAIPAARIYNAVSLSPSTVHIVDDMIALFRESWSRADVRRAIVEHQLAAIMLRHERGGGRDAAALEVALGHYAELERDVDSIGANDFAFGFHLRPDHSCDHLHLHIVLSPLKYRQYSTSAHDYKTKDAHEVRDHVLLGAEAD